MAPTKRLCNNFFDLKLTRNVTKGYTTAQAGMPVTTLTFTCPDFSCKNAALDLAVSFVLFRHHLQCQIPLYKANLLVKLPL